tara:strand:+ start:90 stop:227 length:138 start_codon:yes stop_codon:yes gene_type:complete
LEPEVIKVTLVQVMEELLILPISVLVDMQILDHIMNNMVAVVVEH